MVVRGVRVLLVAHTEVRHSQRLVALFDGECLLYLTDDGIDQGLVVGVYVDILTGEARKH